MRRRPGQSKANSTHGEQGSTLPDAEPEIRELHSRIMRLEGQVARLLKRSPDRLAVDEFTSAMRVGRPSKNKRGAKPKHSYDIAQDRDTFVRFFESYWPEIEPLCAPKPNMPALRSLFSAFLGPEFGEPREAAARLLARMPYIEEFLTNPRMRARFRGDPRALAGALAGVPEVGLWRSLKLCPPSTCKLPVNDSAIRSYIQRKHPPLYRALDAGMELPQLVAWMKEYRTRDKTLQQFGALSGLMRAWDAGRPPDSRKSSRSK